MLEYSFKSPMSKIKQTTEETTETVTERFKPPMSKVKHLIVVVPITGIIYLCFKPPMSKVKPEEPIEVIAIDGYETFQTSNE